MKTKFNKKQIEILGQVDGIISEMRQCELSYDKEILLDLCLNGESTLDFYYQGVSENISDDLIELISEITFNLNELFQDFEEKEKFINDLIYNCLDRFVNNYILGYIKTKYTDNKTGKYANLIINVLKEAQFIDKNLNQIYVDHNMLEKIMLFGVVSFYDKFGVTRNQLHDEFILACDEFQSQFEKDYPLIKDFNGRCFNYFDIKGNGTRGFIRKIINSITKYLFIEVKKQPIYIDLYQNKRSLGKTIYLSVYIGQRLSRRFVYQHQYDMKSSIKKSVLNSIASEVEKQINYGNTGHDLEFLLDILEEKLGIAA